MATPTGTSSAPPGPPPLEPGDHLTRDEFERRYEAMPDLKKAELIEGVVYMPSPVRLDQHGGPHAILLWWLTHYSVFTPGTRVGGNSTVRLDVNNEPQPDGLMIIEPSHGGGVVIGPRGYVESAPELVAEVAASTTSFDLHTKLNVYRSNRVREYLVWRVLDQAIDWFVLRGTDYERLALSPAGFYPSEVFPGLWLDAAALVRSDLAVVLNVLQQGLASPEHAAFVAQLQRQAQRSAPDAR